MTLPSFSFLLTGWAIVIIGNIVFRLVSYYFNKKEKPNNSETIDQLPTLKEAGLASDGIIVYNGLAYWMEKGRVYKATHQDVVHVNTKTIVDPLSQEDIDIQEYMEILEKLELAQK